MRGGRDMDSNRLMHFRAIAESENITKAAEKLFISQPALSKSLSCLEAELGCALFNRVGRRLYLNASGKKLLQYANKMDEILEQIEEDFRQQPNRTLSICGVGNFFSFLLKDYFKDGMKPIRLNVVPDLSIPEILFSGDADVAVADDFYLKDDAKIGLRCIPVLSEQLLLSVPKSHHLAGRKSVKITDLENENIMHSTTSNETNNWLDKVLELNRVKVNWSMAIDSETWRYYMLNVSRDMPPCFESSSSFLTSREMQRMRNCRSLLKVEGVYTNRMIFVWYFENNKEFLAEFLHCVKNIYI
jgi:DNA-binding transcriptional LysR family regulator